MQCKDESAVLVQYIALSYVSKRDFNPTIGESHYYIIYLLIVYYFFSFETVFED